LPLHRRWSTTYSRPCTTQVEGVPSAQSASGQPDERVTLTTLHNAWPPGCPVWGLWVGLVDFLPIVGGALAGIPIILFAFGHSVTAGIVTFAVFIVYTQVENHILNPLVMSRTVKIGSLLVLVSVLAGYSIGSWIGGLFGGFVAGLLAIPSAGAIQILGREAWRAIAGHGKAGLAGIDQEAAGGPSTDGHGQDSGSSPDQGHAVQHVGDRDPVGSHRT